MRSVVAGFVCTVVLFNHTVCSFPRRTEPTPGGSAFAGIKSLALDREGSMLKSRPPATAPQREDQDELAATLPRLAFGEPSATVDSDVRLFSDRMGRVVTSLQAYEAIGRPKDFRQKSATATINGLRLTAGVCTPVRIDVSDNADSTLMIPLAGRCTTLIGTKRWEWAAGENGLFLPQIARGGYCDTRSALLLDVQLPRLRAAAQAMLGRDATSLNFRLDEERKVNLVANGVDFSATLSGLCSIINAVGGSTQMAEALRLDDQFYRVMALMLDPSIVDHENSQRIDFSPDALSTVCEFVMSRLGAPVGLSDMELVSGLSRRSLQYAFLREYGCTPMQWVREQRLLMAQQLLRKKGADKSVTSIAQVCGFINVGAFSGIYRKRFGEYPSDLLRSTRRT